MISPYWQKALSAFLCAAMILSAFPVLATAEDFSSQEPVIGETVTEQESGFTETEQPFDSLQEESVVLVEDGAEAEEVLPEEEIPAKDSAPAEITEEEWVSPTFSFVNPHYTDIITVDEIVPLDSASMYEIDGSCSTVAEAGSAIREQMKARSTAFIFEYTSKNALSQAEVQALFNEFMDEALRHTGNPDEGDYLLWHYSEYKYYYTYFYKNGQYVFDFHCTFNYFTNAEQEAAVDAAVASVLNELDVSGLNDYAKIAAVYDYICASVKYDHNSNSDLKYTAYSALVRGKAVCQGYALLLYRLALELGVDCRIIPGYANGDTHRWDIVLLNGAYYNLDPTYDAGESNYSCFLVSDEHLLNHTRLSSYNTSTFRSEYPVAEEDFTLDGATPSDMNWDNISWSVENGELKVSGSCAIPDCESASQAPWAQESFDSVVISGDISAVGTNVFAGTGISSVTVGENVGSLGEKAFAGCAGLVSVYIKNDSCAIFDAADTLGNPDTTVIYGYHNSTARDYANKYGYEFVSMGFSNRTVTLDVTTTQSAEEPVVRIYDASATDLEVYGDFSGEESSKREEAVVSVSQEKLREDGLYAREVTLQDVEQGWHVIGIYIPELYVIRVNSIYVSGDMELGDYHMWMYADVDDSGYIDARDATQILRLANDQDSLFGSTRQSEEEKLRLLAADVNSDGLYTESDAQTVLDATKLPAPNIM